MSKMPKTKKNKKTETSPEDVYHTNDLPFASYLMAKGEELAYISVDKMRQLVMFCFKPNDKLDFDKEHIRFLNRQTLIDPITFLECKRYLKFTIKNALYGDEDSRKEIYVPMYK